MALMVWWGTGGTRIPHNLFNGEWQKKSENHSYSGKLCQKHKISGAGRLLYSLCLSSLDGTREILMAHSSLSKRTLLNEEDYTSRHFLFSRDSSPAPVFYRGPTRLSFFSDIMADRFNKVCWSRETRTLKFIITCLVIVEPRNWNDCSVCHVPYVCVLKPQIPRNLCIFIEIITCAPAHVCWVHAGEEANISICVVRDASICNSLSTWFGYIFWRRMDCITLMGLCIQIDVGG